MDRQARIQRRLKLRHLETLLAVARHRSMAQAATALAVSQPAVSKAIAEMEHTLGVRLFDRVAHGVEPTLYGSALLKWSHAVFDDVHQGVKEIEFLADPSAGEIKVGATDPIIAGLLPAVIERLHRDYPRISVYARHVLAAAEQAQQLRNRGIDLVIGRLATPFDADIEVETLFQERAFVVAGPGSPWVGRRRIRLADLIDEPWLLPPLDTVIGVLIAEAFASSGLQLPRGAVISTSTQLYGALMAAGPYLAILPHSMLHFSGQRLALRVLSVDIPVVPRPVGIVRLKNRTVSAAAQVFIECAREVAAQLR